MCVCVCVCVCVCMRVCVWLCVHVCTQRGRDKRGIPHLCHNRKQYGFLPPSCAASGLSPTGTASSGSPPTLLVFSHMSRSCPEREGHQSKSYQYPVYLTCCMWYWTTTVSNKPCSLYCGCRILPVTVTWVSLTTPCLPLESYSMCTCLSCYYIITMSIPQQ